LKIWVVFSNNTYSTSSRVRWIAPFEDTGVARGKGGMVLEDPIGREDWALDDKLGRVQI
jgi:hypothetical protein